MDRRAGCPVHCEAAKWHPAAASCGLFDAGGQFARDAFENDSSLSQHLLELGVVGVVDFMAQVGQASVQDLQQQILF